MKKTLLAMATLALMLGQAFATDADYEVSQYAGRDLKVSDTSVVVSVDSSAQINSCQLEVSALELVYDGSNYMNAKDSVTLGKNNATTRNISATTSAAQSWIDALTAADSSQMTLISSANLIAVPRGNPYALQLQGVTAGNAITLTGTTDTLTAQFVGYKQASLTLNDGEIGILLSNDFTTLSLVGKGLTKSPLAPEPATATLSLLALAGLAARRRRN